jgi:hypothetical protein
VDGKCVPWDIVPLAANRYMELNIAHMTWADPRLTGARAGLHLAIVLTGSLESGPQSQVLGWRVLFPNAKTFRFVDTEMWKGPAPRDKTNTLRLATWEILDSSWIKECIAESALQLQSGFRHFVIASSFKFMDIVALTWTSVALGPYDAEKKRLQETGRLW